MKHLFNRNDLTSRRDRRSRTASLQRSRRTLALESLEGRTLLSVTAVDITKITAVTGNDTDGNTTGTDEHVSVQAGSIVKVDYTYTYTKDQSNENITEHAEIVGTSIDAQNNAGKLESGTYSGSLNLNTTGLAPGNYSVKVKINPGNITDTDPNTGEPNSGITIVSAVITVTPTVTLNAPDAVYNGAGYDNASASSSPDVSGFGTTSIRYYATSANATADTNAISAPTNVGIYYARAFYVSEGLDHGGTIYQNASSSVVSFQIAKATATISVSGYTGTYDGNSHTATGTVTGVGNDGILSGLDLGGTTHKDAGTYTDTWTFTDTTGNYNNATGTITDGIAQRAVTITTDAKSKTYGDADPAPTYQITSGSLVAGDAFSGGLTRAAGEDVGTYAIKQGSLGLSTNYALTYAGANLSITARPITVTADAQTMVYGDSDPALTYQVTSGNLVGTDAFTGGLTRISGEDVGTYAIQQGTLTAGSNYSLSYAGANLTVTARPVTITADAKSKVYGDSDPALSYHISSGNLVNGDSFTGALSRRSGEDVGSYAITQGTVALSGNYALTYVGANLTIGQRAVTVTADARTKVYGDADPALTYQVTGGSLVNGDTFSGSLTRSAGEDVGTYAIQQGTLGLSSNYALSYVGANLTITQRKIGGDAVTQAALNVAKMGALDFTITTGQLVNGDTMAALNGAEFQLTIGTKVYSIESTAVASADGKTLYVSWRMSDELKADLSAYLLDTAKSASTAGTVQLTVSTTTQNYDFSDAFATRLFSTAK
jgi:hypothetical protein